MRCIIVLLLLLFINFCSKIGEGDEQEKYLKREIELIFNNLSMKKDYSALVKQIDRENYSDIFGELFPDKEMPRSMVESNILCKFVQTGQVIPA